VIDEWDEYWSKKKRLENFIYDHIAVIYRLLIIKPSLKKYLNQYFRKGDVVLHAGCGSGQVEPTHPPATIIALDISRMALSTYRVHNKEPDLVRGDILGMGFKSESFDGVYNLGVMEHFNDEEIHTILVELNRVLKKGGTAILFWAPENGTTVIIMRTIHFVLNTVFKRNVHLQPAEISLIQSGDWIEKRIRGTGFRIVEIGFGLSDLYTHKIVVMKK
jgi:ubiquinone/menaquinone biosynthesis C-methylase UbiE